LAQAAKPKVMGEGGPGAARHARCGSWGQQHPPGTLHRRLPAAAAPGTRAVTLKGSTDPARREQRSRRQRVCSVSMSPSSPTAKRTSRRCASSSALRLSFRSCSSASTSPVTCASKRAAASPSPAAAAASCGAAGAVSSNGQRGCWPRSACHWASSRSRLSRASTPSH
jgi:hypothetical protein